MGRILDCDGPPYIGRSQPIEALTALLKGRTALPAAGVAAGRRTAVELGCRVDVRGRRDAGKLLQRRRLGGQRRGAAGVERVRAHERARAAVAVLETEDVAELV